MNNINNLIFIRRAISDDALAIKKIHIETYKKSYRGFLPDEYLDSLEISNEVIERTRKYLTQAECHIALYSNIPAGFAYVSHHEDCFEIDALYIHPEHQKQGIGSSLINNICQEKCKHGYNKCIVWTMKFGPSLKFYETQGFTLTSEEKVWKFDIPIIKLQKELNSSQGTINDIG